MSLAISPEDLEVGHFVDLFIDTHRFEITKLDQVNARTGSRRFHVYCYTCDDQVFDWTIDPLRICYEHEHTSSKTDGDCFSQSPAEADEDAEA